MSSDGGPALVAAEHLKVSHGAACLSYAEALQIAERLPRDRPARMVLIDLEQTTEATTAGLARLILLRRQLIQAGGDLRIRGLCSRAEALYEICRLGRLLPRL